MPSKNCISGMLLFLIIAAFTGISQAEEFLNAENEDLKVIFATDRQFGNLIGDIIPLDIIIAHKVKGVILNTERIPSKEFFGEFEIVDLRVEKLKDRTILHYQLQTFRPPKQYFDPATGGFQLFYSADKYWSEADKRHVFKWIEITPFNIYQSSLDPENKISIPYRFDFWFPQSWISVLCILIGIILLAISLRPTLKRFVRIRKQDANRKFLQKIIREDLSLYDPVAVCKKLNAIKREEFLIRVLYEGYRPRNDEISEAAKRILKDLETIA